MGAITVERVVPRSVAEVWSVVSDFAAHRLPLTRVETDPGPVDVGWCFRGVTALGPVRFIDSMVVTQWQPPGAPMTSAGYAVVKTGRLLGGWARVEIDALGAESTRLRWTEQIVLHPHVLGRALGPVTDRAVRWMFEGAVDQMLSRA
jgi:hypothetical protein